MAMSIGRKLEAWNFVMKESAMNIHSASRVNVMILVIVFECQSYAYTL